MRQSPLPSIRQFVDVAYRDWAARMSGALTVPFSALAIAFSGYGRPIFEAMAALCLVITMYRVWAVERGRRIELEKLLAPNLRIEFDPNDARFMTLTKTQDHFDALYIRVIARALSPTVRNSCAFLKRISQRRGDGYVTLFEESTPLPWSYTDGKDWGPRNLNHDRDAYLDIAWLADPKSIFAPFFGFLNANSQLPNSLTAIHASQIIPNPHLNLKLDLVLIGDDCENAYLSIDIHRGGPEWKNPQVGWMNGDEIRRDPSWTDVTPNPVRYTRHSSGHSLH